jgi:hypothetical protein
MPFSEFFSNLGMPRGLVKFFSAAQIATRLLLSQIREIYFSAIFPSKIRPFLNPPALGIGIA